MNIPEGKQTLGPIPAEMWHILLLSALTCCVNVRLLSGDKKNIAVNLFSKLGWELGLYYASYDDFHPDILARMYT